MSSGIWCTHAQTAAVMMALAAGSVDLYLGAAWSSATDIGGSAGGTVAGLMNAASNSAGFASPALMGWVLQKSNDWNLVLMLSVGTTSLAAFVAVATDATRSRGCRAWPAWADRELDHENCSHIFVHRTRGQRSSRP